MHVVNQETNAFIFSGFGPDMTATSLWYRLFTFGVIPQPLHLSLSGQADLWITMHASYSLTVMIASEIHNARWRTKIDVAITTAIRTRDRWSGLKWTALPLNSPFWLIRGILISLHCVQFPCGWFHQWMLPGHLSTALFLFIKHHPKSGRRIPCARRANIAS